MNDPELRYCRCRHLEVSHDSQGCPCCGKKCKRYVYDRTLSINMHNEAVARTLGNRGLNALFQHEEPTR